MNQTNKSKSPGKRMGAAGEIWLEELVQCGRLQPGHHQFIMQFRFSVMK